MNHAPEPCKESSGLGLIAGAGRLPAEAARNLACVGQTVRIYGFDGITDAEPGFECERMKLGQLAQMVEILKETERTRLLIVGKFSTSLLLEASGLLDPDEVALGLLARAGDWQEVGLMAVVADWLEEQGFELCAQDETLASMVVNPFPLTGSRRISGRF